MAVVAVEEAPVGWVSFEHPRGWKVEDEGSYLHLQPRDKSVHLMVAAFANQGGSFAAAVDAKLAAHREAFPDSGPRREVRGHNWVGVRHEADDTTVGRELNTRRIVVCAGHKDLFVTLSLYLDPVELDLDRTTYERLLGSLEFA